MAENFFKNVKKYESKLQDLLKKEKEEYDKIKDYENDFIKNLLKTLSNKNRTLDSELRAAETKLRNKFREINVEAKKFQKLDGTNQLSSKVDEYFSTVIDNDDKSNYLGIPVTQYGVLVSLGIIPKLSNRNNYNHIGLDFNNNNDQYSLKITTSSSTGIAITTLKEISDEGLNNIKDCSKYREIDNKNFLINEDNKIFYDFLKLFVLEELRKKKKNEFEDKEKRVKNSLQSIITIINNKKEELKKLNQDLKDKQISGGKYNNAKAFIEDAIDNNGISISNITDKEENSVEKEKIKQFLSDFIVDLKTIEEGNILKNKIDENEKLIKDEEFGLTSVSLIGNIEISLIGGKSESIKFAEKYSELKSDGKIKKSTLGREYFAIYDELGVSDISAISEVKDDASVNYNRGTE